MAKLPSWQFYPGDWKKDPGVQSLTFEDRGVWFELLLLMFESTERGRLLLNGKPFPMDALARLLGLDKQSLTKKFTTFLESGVASIDEAGVFFNRRMIKDEKLRKLRAECGKLGGNPNLVNQNSNQNTTTQVNQKPTPSSSSSSSKRINPSSFDDAAIKPKKTTTSEEKGKNGWAIWIDANREIGRNDPPPVGVETKSAKTVFEALGKNHEKTKSVMIAFLKDSDPFIKTNGYSISLLPKRIAKYLNSDCDPDDGYVLSEVEIYEAQELENQIAGANGLELPKSAKPTRGAQK